MKAKEREMIVNYLKEMLKTNDSWAKRALVIVYGNQTSHEQTVLNTELENGKGFTKADGYRLASIAKFYVERQFLTPKQMDYVKARISKYWNQIMEVADIDKLQIQALNKEI